MIATHPSLNGLPTIAKKTGWELPPRVALVWSIGESTSPTMSELLVDPATPLVVAVHTGQQADR